MLKEWSYKSDSSILTTDIREDIQSFLLRWQFEIINSHIVSRKLDIPYIVREMRLLMACHLFQRNEIYFFIFLMSNGNVPCKGKMGPSLLVESIEASTTGAASKMQPDTSKGI